MGPFFRRFLMRDDAVEAANLEILISGNSAGKNVLVFTENINATYYIGFDIPLRRMHGRGEINLAAVSQKHVHASGAGCWEGWAESFRPDVVFMTRYAQQDGRDIREFFRRRGTPVIYHIDDDLLDIPESLGAEIQKRQGQASVVEIRHHLIESADLVYVSTAYLANVLRKRFPKQKFFHGIYAPYMGDEIAKLPVVPARDQLGPIVGYMGSKGHQHDLEIAVPALERLLVRRPALSFEVFGTIKMPAALQRFGNRVRSHTVQKSYTEFLATLAGLGWSIGLAPLVDAPFNRCKAPTKFVEYTAAGIPVIASDISVYRDVIPENGGMSASDDCWEVAIDSWLDDSVARNSALAMARAHCSEKFDLAVLENQLRNIIKAV